MSWSSGFYSRSRGRAAKRVSATGYAGFSSVVSRGPLAFRLYSRPSRRSSPSRSSSTTWRRGWNLVEMDGTASSATRRLGRGSRSPGLELGSYGSPVCATPWWGRAASRPGGLCSIRSGRPPPRSELNQARSAVVRRARLSTGRLRVSSCRSPLPQDQLSTGVNRLPSWCRSSTPIDSRKIRARCAESERVRAL